MQLREVVGKALRPVLESPWVDDVWYVGKVVGPVRRFARDWAVAFGFWDDGILTKEVKLGPMDAATAAARTKAQAPLTLYVDPSLKATARMKALLDQIGAAYREVDISADDASRRWLAEECAGARPPQLFVEGKRIGGIADVEALASEGKLVPLVFPRGNQG
jgi:glutaredoxin